MSDETSPASETPVTPGYNKRAALPEPRRLSGKGIAVLVICLAILAAAWAAVFIGYKVDGTSQPAGEDAAAPEPGVTVLIEPLGFEPGDNQMRARLQIAVYGDLESPDDGSLTSDILIAVASDSGIQEVLLQKGRQPSAQEVRIGTTGNFATYPVDKYQAQVQVIADAVERDTGGQITSKEPLDLSVSTAGGIDGWDVASEIPTTQPDQLIDLTMNLKRSGNTLLFTVFLLALMVILVALALVVAVLAVSNRRRIEVDLLGWFAGLLFALPFLRSIFPGAPPVGAAIDVYVFLWLLGLAMIAAVLVTWGWTQQNKAELKKEAAEAE